MAGTRAKTISIGLRQNMKYEMQQRSLTAELMTFCCPLWVLHLKPDVVYVQLIVQHAVVKWQIRGSVAAKM